MPTIAYSHTYLLHMIMSLRLFRVEKRALGFHCKDSHQRKYLFDYLAMRSKFQAVDGLGIPGIPKKQLTVACCIVIKLCSNMSSLSSRILKTFMKIHGLEVVNLLAQANEHRHPRSCDRIAEGLNFMFTKNTIYT